ncbi:MAG TPA: S-adenosylmethionine:tRNA ribosyltransferase-isomerase [Solirubrobacteraceae bacterium]|nr:S-adenosylmethionine:tRNA ribosyltransferase-isomerase [Solirubrobacteraceae bacterium]
MAALAFTLTPAHEASAPPAERDEVRLLVARRDRGALVHDTFRGLPAHLRAGDLLVVNTSATIPAALPATRADGTPLDLHLSTPLPGPEPVRSARPRWVVELRRAGARFRGASAGERLVLPGGASAELLASYLSPGRLWIAALDLPAGVHAYLAEHGRPIAYGHLARPRPLADLQTVFADEPGSAEMPSAGRPFSDRVLDDLLARGVQVAPLVLHTGVASLERGERPYPERYRVPALTATRVNAHRAAGGRVIAVGTTVVRALETVAAPDGRVEAGAGWTGLTVTPERGVRAVDGLLTGWHEPDASHVLMLEAVAGRALIERSYAAALAAGYRWHEFGDSHLIMR